MLPRFPAACLTLALALGASAASAADAPLVPIHTGDELAVAVHGQPTLTQHVVVMPDGSINYPLIGRLSLAGQTPPEAATTITTALAKYVRTPSVTVEVAKSAGTHVLVLGNVKNPGSYDVAGTTRVSDAIAAAGGVAYNNGDLPSARLSNGDGTMRSVSLQQAMQHDTAADVLVGNDAVLYVDGGLTFRITVIGAVDKPGTQDVHVGDKLSSALARAGADWRNYPDLYHIKLTRTTPDGKTNAYTVEFANALGGDGSYDPQLYKDDVVYVPRAKRPLPQGLAIFGLLNRVGAVAPQY